MWKAVLAAGVEFGIMPYGTEAMSTLRIEKGHVVIGAEADGRTTADDLGMGSLVSGTKAFVGRRLLSRPALTAPDRWQLVGLATLHNAPLPRAAKLVVDPDRASPNPMLGHVTSWCRSPGVDAWIALALLANGRARHGEGCGRCRRSPTRGFACRLAPVLPRPERRPAPWLTRTNSRSARR
jgi:sarcosine oxidase subunit alpha